jgi:pilus assembly protein CpaE
MKSTAPSSSDSLSSAVISPDAAFVDLVREARRQHTLGVNLELTTRFDALSKRQLDELKILQPRVIFLDLCDNPRAGCTFAQTLLEDHPAAHIVAVSDDASPDVLMMAMRAGVSEFLTRPVTAQALSEAIDVLRRKLGVRGMTQREGHVIAFFSAKGGAGSTTVATNFAIQLHRATGARTLLVDLDLELGEVALFLGVEPRFSLVDLTQNLHRLDEGLLGTFVQHHESGIDLLAAPWRPREAERVSPDQVRSVLGFLRNRYDYVVADTSNALSPRTVAAFEAADDVFLVTQVDVPSLRNIQRCREMLEELRGGGRTIRLVINRFNPRGELKLKDVTESLGMEVYWVLSNDYDSVTYSINTGKPLVMNVPCAPSTEIEGLIAKFTGMAAPRRRRRSFFSRAASRLSPNRRPLRLPRALPAGEAKSPAPAHSIDRTPATAIDR